MSNIFCRIRSAMLYFVFISMTAAAGSVRGSCTNAAIHRATICTAALKSGSLSENSPNNFISQGDADSAVRACGNGDLLTAINCIERVMEGCKNDTTDAAHFLRKMIDIEKARRSVYYFCTNVRVYTANAECIARYHKDQDICALEARRNYETQSRATDNMDVLMRFQCIFYHVVINCAEKVLSSKCSSQAADIVKTVLVGLEPPICAADTGQVETGRAGTYDVHRSDEGRNNNRGSSSASSVINMLLLLLAVCSVAMNGISS